MLGAPYCKTHYHALFLFLIQVSWNLMNYTFSYIQLIQNANKQQSLNANPDFQRYITNVRYLRLGTLNSTYWGQCTEFQRGRRSQAFSPFAWDKPYTVTKKMSRGAEDETF